MTEKVKDSAPLVCPYCDTNESQTFNCFQYLNHISYCSAFNNSDTKTSTKNAKIVEYNTLLFAVRYPDYDVGIGKSNFLKGE